MLELKDVKVKEGGFIEAVYRLTNSIPGRDGSVLELDISVLQHQYRGKTWIEVGGLRPELNTLDTGEALDKLAEWAERLAESLRHRGPATPAVVAFAEPKRVASE